MKTHYVKDIRVLSAFQQTIRAMQILILVLRVLAVAFLVLQSITLMRITHRHFIYIIGIEKAHGFGRALSTF